MVTITVVTNVIGTSGRIWVEDGKLAKGWSGEPVGKHGIRALLEARPAAPPENDRVLHHARMDNTRSYAEGGGEREAL